MVVQVMRVSTGQLTALRLGQIAVDTRRRMHHTVVMLKIQSILIMSLLGLCSCISLASPDTDDVEPIRRQIIEKYNNLSLMLVEEHADGEKRINQIVVRSDGACARRTFWLPMLSKNPMMDPQDAELDWLDVAVGFMFYDGENTTIGQSELDRYVVRTIDTKNPWGANPANSCIWPMLAGLAKEGEIQQSEEGGWSLRSPNQFLTVNLDADLLVRTIEYKYDPDKPSLVRWTYSGYEHEGGDPRLPSRLNRQVVIYHPDGTVYRDTQHDAKLKYFPERAKAALPFRRENGSVNLMSPNRAKALRQARDSGRTLDEVLNASSCGPLYLGFERYDPETGDLYKDDGTLLYNLKEIAAQARAEMEAQGAPIGQD